MLAGNQLRQILLALLFRAVDADLIDREIGVRAVGEPDRCGAARDFLHGDAVFQIAETRTAIRLLDGDAVQAQFAQLRPEMARELVRPVHLLGNRSDVVGGE